MWDYARKGEKEIWKEYEEVVLTKNDFIDYD